MTLIQRTTLTLALTLALGDLAHAQNTAHKPAASTTTTTTTAAAATDTTTTTTAATTSSAPQAAASDDPAEENGQRQTVRHEFRQLLARHPDDLARVLLIDTTLLSNEAFVARYPELAQFLTEHPEVRRNPHYYLSGLESEYDRTPLPPRSGFEQLAEAISIIFVAGLIASALMWLVRTIVEQKRWTQLSRRQTEVHTKILDRLGSSEELLAYIKSPAGSKYLESAPIALHVAPAAQRTPVNRVLLSIQIGIIVAAAGLGMLLVSGRTVGDAEQGFFAMGVIAFCVGGGFILSAFASLVMGRRFGLGQSEAAAPSPLVDEVGSVR